MMEQARSLSIDLCQGICHDSRCQDVVNQRKSGSWMLVGGRQSTGHVTVASKPEKNRRARRKAATGVVVESETPMEEPQLEAVWYESGRLAASTA